MFVEVRMAREQRWSQTGLSAEETQHQFRHAPSCRGCAEPIAVSLVLFLRSVDFDKFALALHHLLLVWGRESVPKDL